MVTISLFPYNGTVRWLSADQTEPNCVGVELTFLWFKRQSGAHFHYYSEIVNLIQCSAWSLSARRERITNKKWRNSWKATVTCTWTWGSDGVCVPEMAICWILNWILMVGFSSGLDAPACRLMVPFRLGSFCGLILPTSHVNNWFKKKKKCTKMTELNILSLKHIQIIWVYIFIHSIIYTSSVFLWYKDCCKVTFVTGSKVYVPWEGFRLALRTPRGSWLLTRTDSTALPIVCLGPRVKSKRPWELPSRKVMLCFTYTGMATKLKVIKQHQLLDSEILLYGLASLFISWLDICNESTMGLNVATSQLN